MINNKQFLIEARAKRRKLYNTLALLNKQSTQEFNSTLEITNVLYPTGPFYGGLFKTGNYPQNINSDKVLGRLKILEKEGYLESKIQRLSRVWKIIKELPEDYEKI